MNPDDYEITVNVSIRNNFGGGNLELRDSVRIPNCSFSDMADVLRGFHELATSIAAAKARTDADHS